MNSIFLFGYLINTKFSSKVERLPHKIILSIIFNLFATIIIYIISFYGLKATTVYSTYWWKENFWVTGLPVLILAINLILIKTSCNEKLNKVIKNLLKFVGFSLLLMLPGIVIGIVLMLFGGIVLFSGLSIMFLVIFPSVALWLTFKNK